MLMGEKYFFQYIFKYKYIDNPYIPSLVTNFKFRIKPTVTVPPSGFIKIKLP
jgi:hypothetical protein